MNAYGIIFSDSYSNSIQHELVRTRSSAALPIACRFRAIDFVLSNMVSAGVGTIGLLTKQNYASLMEHIGSGKDWDLGRKHGGVTMLTPFAHGNTVAPDVTNGKLDALRTVPEFLQGARGEYVILAQGNVVANLDFKDILRRHQESEADVTLVHATVGEPDGYCLAVQFDEQERLADVRFCTTDKPTDISLGCYVMSKAFLLSFMEKAELYDWHDLARDLLVRGISELKINGYKHEGYAAVVSTVSQYYHCNMDFLDPAQMDSVFPADRPILTRIHDSVPTMYAYDAKVQGSILADGCDINGTVKNSVIFRNVTIEKGATVENCIIMQGAHIGKNAVLRNVICDMSVSVSPDVQLSGSANYPYVLAKGSKV